MEGIDAAHRARAALRDLLVDVTRTIGRDVGDLGAALGAQLVEEPGQPSTVTARAGPHQVRGVMVDDHGQVLVVAAVGDFIDPDPA